MSRQKEYYAIPQPFVVRINTTSPIDRYPPFCKPDKYIEVKVLYAESAYENTFGGRYIFNLLDEDGCCVSPKRHRIEKTYLILYGLFMNGKLRKIPNPFIA